ncbi:putative acetyltransferase [Saccharopolyspora lacisalsi]|uniref:Putative acetyltransferase n=1 Tax=Halosaccharopolyspora lacisalsi TaxID=1000566 RepID=A0A839E4W5_9PSEU|nr:N-acetyltransferase [Halosaccharopolyspora lacisalsi]MBA8826875.1 putative acetyltransferase [Halosaccharopolyspora lacisalsi]
MLIRRELPQDAAAVHAVHAAAFHRPELPESTPREAPLVDELRDTSEWLPRLSLVAVEETVVGHVVCSRGRIDDHAALGLGPIGVLPAHQRRGVGSALMRAVLGAADALDEPIVVLLGSPNYYPRFGFGPAAEHGIHPPVAEWEPAFQACPLTGHDPEVRGTFRYPAPFDAR